MNTNFTENNKIILREMCMKNPQLSELNINGNLLSYNNEEIDISNFDFYELINTETYFFGQLENLNSEDIFKIIRLHAVTINRELNEKKQNVKKQTSNEMQLDAIKEINPLLKNVTISYKKNEYGNDEEYINIVDEKGNNHLLYNYAKTDIIQIYKDLLNRTGNPNITLEELYSECLRKLKEVHLTDTYDILNSSKTSEEFATKVQKFEHDHTQDKHYSLGNEEHDILISNDHTVTSFTTNEYGDMVQQDHKAGNLTEETEKNKVVDEKTEDILNISEKEEEIKIKLISEEKFYQLIDSDFDLSKEDLEQIELFNSYLGELMIYRDYLLPKLSEILARFENKIVEVELADYDILTKNQMKELEKYYELRQKKDLVQLENKEKSKEEVMRLEYKMPVRYDGGHINYIAIIIAILIVTGALSLVVFTLIK